MQLLAKVEHKDTIDKALKLFEKYLKGDTAAIHPELRSMVFGVVALKHPKAAEHLQEIREKCNNGEVERDCLTNLGRVANEGERKKVFDEGIIGGKIRSQDVTVRFSVDFVETLV